MRLSFKNIALSLSAAFALGSCSSATKPGVDGASTATPVPGSPTSSQVGPPEPYGPLPTEPASSEPYGPEQIQYRPIILVLGPGAARGFAHVGVIKALHEAKIPIAGIVGTEMGALVGTLFAMSESINQFEWALMRFKEDAFPDQESILPDILRGAANGGKISSALEEALQERDLKEARLPMQIVLEKTGLMEAWVQTEGQAASVVRASMSIPDFIQPVQWEGNPVQAALKKRPFAVSEAKLLNGPVVLVDVLDEKAAPSAAKGRERKLFSQMSEARRLGLKEYREADLVLRPKLKDIGYLDYKKRNQAVFHGKSAVKEKLAAIRQLVGLPPNPMEEAEQ